MNCDRIEDLLPAYLEEDLSSDDAALVEQHLGACEACALALREFQELEAALSGRANLRSAPQRTAARVVSQLGLGSRLRIWDALLSVPGAIAAAMIVVGVVSLYFGDVIFSSIVRALGRMGAGAPLWVEQLERGVNSTVGGSNEIVMYALYAGVFLLICLSGSWMVLRYVRD